MWSGAHKAVLSLGGLREELGRVESRWALGTQEDASEFLASILSMLREGFSGGSRALSPIDEIFQIETHTQLSCPTCGNERHIFEDSTQLEVDLPRKGTATIEECVAKSAGGTIETGVEWFCGACMTNVQANRRTTITKFPEVLVIIVKRFQFTMKGGIKKKKNPIQLHGKPINFGCEMGVQEAYFHLAGVIDHHGGLGGGHYTARVLNPQTTKWFYYNDSRVEGIDEPCRAESTPYALLLRRSPHPPLVPSSLQSSLQSGYPAPTPAGRLPSVVTIAAKTQDSLDATIGLATVPEDLIPLFDAALVWRDSFDAEHGTDLLIEILKRGHLAMLGVVPCFLEIHVGTMALPNVVQRVQILGVSVGHPLACLPDIVDSGLTEAKMWMLHVSNNFCELQLFSCPDSTTHAPEERPPAQIRRHMDQNLDEILENRNCIASILGNLMTREALAHRMSSEILQSAHSGKINDLPFPYQYSKVCATAGMSKIHAFGPQNRKHLLQSITPILKAVTSIASAAYGERIIWGRGIGQGLESVDNQHMVASMTDHRGTATKMKESTDDECVSCSSDDSCIIWDLNTLKRRNRGSSEPESSGDGWD
ncbi:hypothetical protein BSKO_04656 [Bryopsis sp. KO-2023]|nr:hypothetical protein BSKO_04656 [Bryopsis sp. KO-2023]